MLRLFVLLLISVPLPRIWAQTVNTEAIAKQELLSAEMRRGNLRRTGTGTNYDVKYYRQELKADPRVLYLSGKVTCYFKALSNLDSIAFDLHDNLTVDSIHYHGQRIAQSRTKHRISAIFPSTLNNQSLDSVSIFYQGKPLRDGLGYFVRENHSAGPIIYTLSQPYGSYYWWPCKQGLTDKADSFDQWITCPKAYLAAGIGTLVGIRDISDSLRTHIWKHRYPIVPYLAAFAISNYQRIDHMHHFHSGDSMPLINYVFPQNAVKAFDETKETLGLLRLFDSLFGIYPFSREKYGHAQFTWGGGMEHQTMSFMVNFGWDLNAHELAHQWFGDMATCGTWTELWLNEGFATYLNGLAYEFLKPEGWQDYLKDMVNSITAAPDGSVYCADTVNLNRLFSNRLTYKKGAMLLHMLRWYTGDTAFFAGLRDYLKDPAVSYGFGRTAILVKHLETRSGKNLTAFMNDWYFGQGYPTYFIWWEQTGTKVSLSIRQEQSHPSVSFFNIPVPIAFHFSSDTIVRVFDPGSAFQSFEFETSGDILSAEFDPATWILGKANIGGRNNNLRMNPALTVYPNPGNGNFSIISKEYIIENIELIDETGKLVYKKDINPDKRINTSFPLDLSFLKSGVYFLKAQTNAGTLVSKLTRS